MRKLIVAAAIVAASFSPAAFADETAAISTSTTLISDIMANEKAKAIFEELAPDIATNPDLEQGYGMTLAEVAGYVPDMLSEEKLKELDAAFAEIE